MKDETQATHLRSMMQAQSTLKTYTVALQAVSLKRSAIHKLQKGDIILLHTKTPLLYLYLDDKCAAQAVLDACKEHIVITKHYEDATADFTPPKKYETLLCAFGSLPSKGLEEGMHLKRGDIAFDTLTLFADGKEMAKGRAVWVEGRLAVEITKVKR